MSEQLNKFGMGARFIPASELDEIDLGPLKGLVGEWESVVLPNNEASGWNVISVPAATSFTFEVIPYKENLKFSAVAVEAGNRGPIINGNAFDQQITGLFYEQQIISVCDTEFCDQRGFKAGTVIHAETGLFLYLNNYSSGLDIARLGTVPHGNALLALGTANTSTNPGTEFFPVADAKAFNLDKGTRVRLGYNDKITRVIQFPNFDQVFPNTFLESTLKQIVGSGTLTNMTTLDMSTSNPNATGGILNIPFIQSNVKATAMDATFWLEQITGGSESELLQYSQTINLVFPMGGDITPIVWPHITISTLKRMPVVPPQAQNLKSAVSPSGNTPGVPQL